MPTARQIAERALGKPLPRGAEVHHVNSNSDDNRPGNLVICQDAAYHDLLHRRMRARGVQRPADAPLSYTIRNVDDDFWRQVKSKAASESMTVKAVIESLLREWLARRAADARRAAGS